MGNSSESCGDFDQLFHTQYEHKGVEIALPIPEFKTESIDNGIDLRKHHHRTCSRLDTAGD